VKTDSVIKSEGMRILIDNLGKVDAERFISLIITEPFDYTKWQDKHFDADTDVREFSKKAMKVNSKV